MSRRAEVTGDIGDRRRTARRGAGALAARGARRALGMGLVVAGVLTCTSVSALGATGTLTVTPATGLVKGQIVTVTASGLPSNSKGWIVECNMAAHEPTVQIASPVQASLPVGCSPPSLRQIYSTGADGTLDDTFAILLGRQHVGPPCGRNVSVGACPTADSRGQRPGADAQNFPCPPTPAQQVAGVSCVVMFVDASGIRVSAPISFQGGGPAVKGVGGSGGGGGGATTTTKPPKTTSTTKAHGSGGGGAATTVTYPRIVTAAQTATTVAAPHLPGALANTGPGPTLRVMFVVGVLLTITGAGMLLAPMRRRFLDAFLGR